VDNTESFKQKLPVKAKAGLPDVPEQHPNQAASEHDPLGSRGGPRKKGGLLNDDEMVDVDAQEEQAPDDKIYSIKQSISALVLVIKSRRLLHAFIIEVLRKEDFHWGSSDQSLNCVISFFEMLDVLLRRGFFEHDYDELI
jgi:hypothetical protein